MSRNKENIPLRSSQRANGSLRSPPKNVHSDEFFTDSLLDVTRLSSRIPTPSPQKAPLVKPRRARTTKLTRSALPSLHRSSASENVIPRLHHNDRRPSTPQRNGTSAPKLRTQSLSTPPDPNDELPLASPYSSISSPPPQDITDAYQQIQDEEDLAQTERELSSDESHKDDEEPAKPIRLHQRSHSESKIRPSAPYTRSSAASTPTRSTGTMNRQRTVSGQAETLSEASGLSFLRDITDRGLADALTPHMSERAKDKARLREVWDQKQPKAFSRALYPVRETTAGEPSAPEQKKLAFTKAGQFTTNGLPTWNEIRDSENGFRPHQYQEESILSGNSPLPMRYQPPKVLPTNPNAERHFHFTRNHGFPQNRPALTEKNLEQQNRGSPVPSQTLRSHSSVPSLLSDRSSNQAQVLGDSTRTRNGQPSRLPLFRRSLQVESKPNNEEPSQIDWAAAAADVPIPSVENSTASAEQDSTPASRLKFLSPDKSRRWDNDFTGQSFQVSESPPVRQKSASTEPKRDKEIEGVAKQAVTTNRLSELRERHSQENLRSASRSPAPRSTSRSNEAKTRPSPIDEDESEVIGLPVPDTPVVIYRTSSNSGSDNITRSPVMDHSTADRHHSHDHLQRLARAMSSTPRSSPASGSSSNNREEKLSVASLSQKQETTSRENPAANGLGKEPASKLDVVAETPKVSGAWTDTILPETVKPMKQTDRQTAVTQTPHVSAGGWIDTPAPVEVRKYSGNISTIIEEVPEELTAGIVKDTVTTDTIKAEISPEVKVMLAPQSSQQSQASEKEQPKSALASIIEQQKQRLVSQDLTTATREDTLNLGNETLESLQDLLALDEEDITTLSRLSLMDNDSRPLNDIRTEAQLLERLNTKLDRMRNNIQDARKGISKLEHQVSQPMAPSTMTTAQQLLNDTICTVCNQQTFQPHIHPESQYIPYASLHLSLPIPLLFKPRKANQWLPRPTILGTATIVIWIWYLVETIMCELYCRPEYTDFYVWPSEPEPEFPFVLPTMLTRWTRLNTLAVSTYITTLYHFTFRLLRAFWRILTMAFGFSDGFVADGPPTSITKQVVETATSIAATASGVDLSMNDDEFL